MSLVIEIYGMEGCSNCDKIVKKIEESDLEFSYIKDKKLTMDLAKKLHSEGKLLEQTAPLILKDDEQITHEDLEKLL